MQQIRGLQKTLKPSFDKWLRELDFAKRAKEPVAGDLREPV